MASVQCRSLDILLHDVTVFRFCHLLSEKLVPLALSLGAGVLLLHFDALLHLQVLFHLEPSSFSLSIESHSHLLDFAANEDTTTLTTGFGFANVEYHWIFFRLGLSHHAIFYLLSAFLLFPLLVFLNIVEFGRVNPCLRKEIKVIGELLFEFIKVNT